MSVLRGSTSFCLLLLTTSACHRTPSLTPADLAPPRENTPPPAVSDLDTRSGFGTLSEAEGDAGVRDLALRFVAALSEENTGQLRILLQHATWQPGLARGTPFEELSRRMALQEFQALKLPLAQGAFDAMQVRGASPSGVSQSSSGAAYDVRLPTVALPEPLFAGRPVLRIVRSADALTIASYGEE